MYLLKFLKESQNTNIKTKDLRNKSSKKNPTFWTKSHKAGGYSKKKKPGKTENIKTNKQKKTQTYSQTSLLLHNSFLF